MLVYLELVTQLLDVVDEENALALTTITRLDDHHRVVSVLRPLLRHVALQLCHLVWDDPGLGEEAKVDRVLIFHLLKALR